jgi:hypothetical protein
MDSGRFIASCGGLKAVYDPDILRTNTRIKHPFPDAGFTPEFFPLLRLICGLPTASRESVVVPKCFEKLSDVPSNLDMIRALFVAKVLH